MFWWVQRRFSNARGFTLIELLIVVVIIAILAAILVPNFLRVRAQAQIAGTDANEKNLGVALESYFVDTGVYPNSLSQLVLGNYIRAVPNDPCTNGVYGYAAGTSNMSYALWTPGWTNTQCASVANGVSYTPSVGLVQF